MDVEVVEVGPHDHELWASAVNRFKSGGGVGDNRFLSDPTTVALVARAGSRVAGWAWGYRQARPDGDTMLLLYELDVVAEQRRRGVGRSLIETFLSVARREGHRRVWVLTEVDNEAAVTLYEATGGERAPSGQIVYQWLLPRRR